MVIRVPQAKRRVTVDLPEDLVKRATSAVRQGAARSRTQLIAQALEAYLHLWQESQIDAQFAAMAHDDQYRTLALRVAQEFERSDWEALRLSESKP